MLKRLIVLVAALALVFVFVPTSSAQQTDLPTDCAGDITSVTELEDCLNALDADGSPGVPEECTTFLDPANLVGLNLLNPTEDLRACLTAITRLDGAGVGEPAADGAAYDAAYDAGYGYDLGYDIGYDEGVPEGGVDSGFGPTGSEASGAPLVARGAALLALVGVLGTGLLIMRRRHGS